MTEFDPQLELKPLPKIPLPHGWSEMVLMALLHVRRIIVPTSQREFEHELSL